MRSYLPAYILYKTVHIYIFMHIYMYTQKCISCYMHMYICVICIKYMHIYNLRILLLANSVKKKHFNKFYVLYWGKIAITPISVFGPFRYICIFSMMFAKYFWFDHIILKYIKNDEKSENFKKISRAKDFLFQKSHRLFAN